MNRRELLKAAVALPLAQTALSHAVFAQSPYPSRNVTMIVPFPPGGQADLAARPVAQALEKILGKPVIVENRAGGGGGSVGNAAAARADADGHTLLMTLSSLAVLPEADRLFDRPVAYEVSQFAPVARVLADPTLLAVPASAPGRRCRKIARWSREPASHFFVRGNVAWPHSFDRLAPRRRAEPPRYLEIREKGPGHANAADCPEPCMCVRRWSRRSRARVVARAARNLGTADGLHAGCLAALQRSDSGRQSDRDVFAAEHAATLQ